MSSKDFFLLIFGGEEKKAKILFFFSFTLIHSRTIYAQSKDLFMKVRRGDRNHNSLDMPISQRYLAPMVIRAPKKSHSHEWIRGGRGP